MAAGESTLFKDAIDASVVARYAEGLRGTQGFDPDAFAADALEGLQDLELKARVEHISARLRDHLPADYGEALAALTSMLDAAPGADGPNTELAHWPMAQFVEDHGPSEAAHFDASVAAMKRITEHFSCEFAVRSFLVRYPDRMLAEIRAWAVDGSPRVRRNASEGIRPRLPWGARLTAFIADPEPVFEVLELLRKDPQETVRRSVSNCLNDIAKDHPERLMDVLERWDDDADQHTEWIKRRALRTLVKAGDPRALALLGFGPPRARVDALALDAPRFRVGDTMTLSFVLVSEGDAPQDLHVDYRVHYVKKNGTRTPKVFKLKTVRLGPGERREITRRQHLKPISTRRYHPGTHAVDVQVNGVVLAVVSFELDE